MKASPFLLADIDYTRSFEADQAVVLNMLSAEDMSLRQAVRSTGSPWREIDADGRIGVYVQAHE